MGTVGVYIRSGLVKPFERYCKKQGTGCGTTINELIKEKLLMEGLINE